MRRVTPEYLQAGTEKYPLPLVFARKLLLIAHILYIHVCLISIGHHPELTAGVLYKLRFKFGIHI